MAGNDSSWVICELGWSQCCLLDLNAIIQLPNLIQFMFFKLFFTVVNCEAGTTVTQDPLAENDTTAPPADTTTHKPDPPSAKTTTKPDTTTAPVEPNTTISPNTTVTPKTTQIPITTVAPPSKTVRFAIENPSNKTCILVTGQMTLVIPYTDTTVSLLYIFINVLNSWFYVMFILDRLAVALPQWCSVICNFYCYENEKCYLVLDSYLFGFTWFRAF